MKYLYILILLAAFILIANVAKAQWEQDVRLTNDTAASATPMNRGWCVAASGDSVHVVWYDMRDGNFEIYYKRSTDAGKNWGTDTRLTNAPDSSRNPAISISGSVVHIVWTDKRDGNFEIYYKRSTDGGTNWGADTRLTNDPGNSGTPCIAVSGLDVQVVWRDDRDGNLEVYYKNSTDGGNTWGKDYHLTGSSAISYNPSVSISGSVVHIAWEDTRDGNDEIYYKRSTDGGLIWGEDTRLTNNLEYSNLPILTALGSDLYLVWNDSRDGNYEIYYKRSTDGGLSWGEDTRLTNAPGNSWWSSIAVSGSVIYITWQDNRNGNDEIFYKCSKDGGLTWSSDTILADNKGTMSERPSIAISGSVVHVVWTDMRDGPNGEIYYKRNPKGNTTGIDDLIAENNVLNFYPNPAVDELFINYSSEIQSPASLNIFNVLGISVYERENINTRDNNSININTGNLAPGVYFLTITAGNYTETKKLVIIR